MTRPFTLAELRLTDPTTPAGQAYWAERGRFEEWQEHAADVGDDLTDPAAEPFDLPDQPQPGT